MTETITIPLSKLAPWTDNVRRTSANDGIEELAASIAAHGLLQSLVVRKGKRGKFEIVAGRRRYLALTKLAAAGAIDQDYAVACMLASSDIDASELSLAENIVRAPMHPADQYEAFSALEQHGASPADIAARFGLSELAVTQRLKLGRLAPAILGAYRAGDLTLECAQAFTVTDDHDAQVRVYDDLPSWNREPHIIRRALTEDEVPSSDKRVRFLGLDTYLDAGGAFRRDLFSVDGEGYILNVELLDRLVSEKLKAEAALLAAEGWAWIETCPDTDYQTLARFSRRHPEHVPLTDADQAEHDRLAEDYDTLVDADDADETALADIEQRMDALSAKSEAWSAETLSVAGAIVTLDHQGRVRVERGLVRKEDLAKLKPTAADDTASEHGDALSATAKPGLSPKLIEELTAEKSAAIAAELTGLPDMGLTAVVHALTLEIFFPGRGQHSCLKLRLQAPGLAFSMAKPDASKALTALMAEKERVGDRIPGDPAHLWDWCLARSRDELLQLLAFIAAYAVDTVQAKGERADSDRLMHGNALAQAVTLDMTEWYAPTSEGYFNRIRRSQIMASIDEAKGGHGPALDKLKKSELAARAEVHLAGTGWLPEPLRISGTPAPRETRLAEAAE